VKVNPTLLEKRMYLYPAFEAKHLANCGLRKPLCAITFQRQPLKRNTRGILALRSNLPSKFVWYLVDIFHMSRIVQLIFLGCPLYVKVAHLVPQEARSKAFLLLLRGTIAIIVVASPRSRIASASFCMTLWDSPLSDSGVCWIAE